MNTIKSFEEKIYRGCLLTKEDALSLSSAPFEELCSAANRIRIHFCGNNFDICTIINGKSGHCPENCKYCAQSAHNHADIKEYPLLDTETLVKQALYNAKRGVLRYSIVTSGRALSDSEITSLCESIRRIKQLSPIKICISLGLLNASQYRLLLQAGASRVHNNLEASEHFFPNICTTHTIANKIDAIHAARSAGLSVCSGGIIGLGESMEDRIDLCLMLRDLDIHSVPINLLNPIPGTPLADQPPLEYSEICRSIAVFRFLLPNAAIRLAGGRGLMPDKGKKAFLSGANAAISGDMLTTSGITIETDIKMITECGYTIGLLDE